MSTVYKHGIFIEGTVGGQGFNRELSATQITDLTTTVAVRFTWPTNSRPKSIEVKPVGGACWVCFDAPDPATGLLWCQGANGEAVDSQRYLVPEYLPEETASAGPTGGRAFDVEFDGTLSNIYILEYSSAITALITEAS